MTVGLCLSGGGAKGDFELGAIRCLYDRGIVPTVLSSTSVGSINAVKLAEGEDPADPTRGLPGLESLWAALHNNAGMYVDAAWLHDPDMDPQLRDLLTGRTSSLGITSPTAATSWGLLDGIVTAISDFSFLVGDGASLLKSLNLATTAAHSLFELTPISALLNSKVNLDHVASWVASGGKWRMSTVALESGRLRYITESGQVVERDGTAVMWGGPLTAACQKLQAAVQSAEQNVTSLQNQLRAAAGSAKSTLIGQIAQAQQELAAARQAFAQCVASQPPVPLTTDIRTGVLASASMPAIFAAVPIGHESYVDGGVREILPVQAAVDLGADEIYAISASALTPEAKPGGTYAKGMMIDIASRAVLDLALNEIEIDDTRPVPVAGAAAPKIVLIAPDADVHDTLVVDPGLIQINRDYGWMRAADVLDGVAPGSARWTSATQIAMTRRATWRAENHRYGHSDPTQPPPGGQNPDQNPPPDSSAQAAVDSGKTALAQLLTARTAAGGPLPANIQRWVTTLELHPWSEELNDARFVSQQVPATITSGQQAQVNVVMRNTGTTTWSEATGHRLGSQSPQDNTTWGPGRRTLSAPVPPGAEATFAFAIAAPAASGASFQWQMVQDHVQWFGQLTPAVHVGPTVSPQCAQLTAQAASLTSEIAALQQELRQAAGSQRSSILSQIADDQQQLADVKQKRRSLGCP